MSGASSRVPDMGLSNLGKSLGQAAQIIEQQNEYADELRVEEGVNRLREKQLDLSLGQENGYSNVNGRNALPQDGVSMTDRYTQKFESAADEISGGFANERQKALFGRYRSRTALQFREGAMRHENQQITHWRNQTVQGVVDVEADTAAKNWNNPEAVDLSIGRIDINLQKKRQAEGLPADEMQRIRMVAMSKLHKGVVEQAIGSKNFDYARKHLEKYGSEIDSDVSLTLRKALDGEAETSYAITSATKAVRNAAPSLMPSDRQRLGHLQFGQESNHQQFGEDGKPLTSRAGATGYAQVMPTTGPEAAKLAGLPWNPEMFHRGQTGDAAKDKEAREYNMALGNAYMDAQIKKYGGDLSKALAAYNAGPGRLDEVIKQAEKDGKPDQWLSYLPQETRDYVSKIKLKFQAGEGAPRRMTFEDIDRNLQSDPHLMGNPKAYAAARKFAKEQWEDMEKVRKTQLEQAESDVYRQIEANGGDFDKVPFHLRQAMDPTKIDTARAYAKKLRNGEDIATDWEVYHTIKSSPQVLKNANLYALRSKLGNAEFKELVEKQTDLLQGKAGAETSILSTKQTVDNLLKQSGIDPTPAHDKKNDAAKVGKFWSMLETNVRFNEQYTGKKMSTAEIEKEAARLLTKISIPGMLYGTNEKPIFEATPQDIQNMVVPDEERAKIVEALKKRGKPANEQEIRSLYQRSLRFKE